MPDTAAGAAGPVAAVAMVFAPCLLHHRGYSTACPVYCSARLDSQEPLRGSRGCGGPGDDAAAAAGAVVPGLSPPGLVERTSSYSSAPESVPAAAAAAAGLPRAAAVRAYPKYHSR